MSSRTTALDMFHNNSPYAQDDFIWHVEVIVDAGMPEGIVSSDDAGLPGTPIGFTNEDSRRLAQPRQPSPVPDGARALRIRTAPADSTRAAGPVIRAVDPEWLRQVRESRPTRELMPVADLTRSLWQAFTRLHVGDWRNQQMTREMAVALREALVQAQDEWGEALLNALDGPSPSSGRTKEASDGLESDIASFIPHYLSAAMSMIFRASMASLDVDAASPAVPRLLRLCQRCREQAPAELAPYLDLAEGRLPPSVTAPGLERPASIHWRTLNPARLPAPSRLMYEALGLAQLRGRASPPTVRR